MDGKWKAGAFALELKKKVVSGLEKHGLRILSVLKYSEVKFLDVPASWTIWHP